MKKLLVIMSTLVLSIILCMPVFGATTTKTAIKSVTLTSTSFTYNGKERKPDVTVKAIVDGKSKTLVKGKDFTVSYSNNIDAGTATVTVKGQGNYKGTKSASFEIKQKSLTGTGISVDGISNKAYTGNAIKLSPVVSFNGNTLTKGTDYTVSYKNNTERGTATVTFKGIGNFKGTLPKEFKITKAKITDAKLKYATVKWTGEKKTQSKDTVVYSGSKVLTYKTDYKIPYSNNVNQGTATMIIEGIGNYKGRLTKEFVIKCKHNWVTDTETIHHDAVTQKVVDQPAYDETIYEQVWVLDVPGHYEKGAYIGTFNICNECGAEFDITDEMGLLIHLGDVHDMAASYHAERRYEPDTWVDDQGHYEEQATGTKHHKEKSHIEEVTPAYDETITTTYCSVCGATK